MALLSHAKYPLGLIKPYFYRGYIWVLRIQSLDLSEQVLDPSCRLSVFGSVKLARHHGPRES